ncbi:Cysteine-rich CPCC [Lentzea waywayandensis]|uniref:Cysteine-rich CPCC n=1 Tax=Lentzea waywayandensis TaxID=84724 RepID=A0A1I6FB17_9PSEU|nr:CPCC family cysteine-rich protein [Lentzea waywayandensis]SFR27110.1 Cysteine-rich CPCC [Lentzea waywayandensis]
MGDEAVEGEGWSLVRRAEPAPRPVDGAWFGSYISMKNVYGSADGGPYTCSCCGHLTLTVRAAWEICRECGWEDDGQDDHDSSVVRGGPNGPVSLDDERAAYVAEGGVRGDHVPPGPAV